MQESSSDDNLNATADTSDLPEIQLEINPLGTHPRGNFCCGVSRIDNFFKNNARKDHQAYKVRVFVATEEGQECPVGFYSLTLTALLPSHVSKNATKKFDRVKAVPAIYLSMIGVTDSFQKKGVGRALIQNAISRALLISEHAGAYAIVLEALDEKVAAYYRELGFEPFIEGKLHMFLELSMLRRAVAAS